ncbi:MAG: ribonuclease G [Gammaproteobacteria bacterium]|nr:ribonuclease G [Gammaproteobacteria bacterium]
MNEEILVNVTPRESRAALLDGGVLQEVYIERSSRRGLISNIYKGKVCRVLPGMQAAFIEIGMQRTAFLHVSDMAQAVVEGNDLEDLAPANIDDLVSQGNEILVQVVKDPLGTKGARLTTYITLPSRFMVFMPKGSGVGVSTRIEDPDERQRLRELTEGFLQEGQRGGFIVRTAAEGVGFEALRADMQFLQKLWDVISERALMTPVGKLVHADLELPLRILRDVTGQNVTRVQVDSDEFFQKMCEFARMFVPEMLPKIERYSGQRPIFDLYGVEEELQKALERKVPLKSGGYLIIDQTEAMTTIDVNTGAYVGHRNLEETIFKTNLEAAVTIARQLRLRNLGGIIILDFIDMLAEEHRSQVLAALQRSLESDNAHSKICEVSSLGLVEMTRKRTRESLENMLCEACPTCEGRGRIKTPESVCHEIFREIIRHTRQFDFQKLLVLAHPEVIETLLDDESTSVAELESLTGHPIRLQAEAMYNQEQFDVVPL